MRYVSTLLAVRDMERSKRFYQEVMELEIEDDFGANVTLTGGVALQTMDTWKSFLHREDVTLPNHAGELYFETGDIDAFCEKLASFPIEYIHPLFEHRWGQRVVRFYDPDYHIIEVGERMVDVVRRFVRQGMTPEETAVRMDVPLAFVESCLE